MGEKGVTKPEGWKLKWEKANLKIENIFYSEAIRNTVPKVSIKISKVSLGYCHKGYVLALPRLNSGKSCGLLEQTRLQFFPGPATKTSKDRDLQSIG